MTVLFECSPASSDTLMRAIAAHAGIDTPATLSVTEFAAILAEHGVTEIRVIDIDPMAA